MRYTTLSTVQLTVLAVLMSITTAALVTIAMIYVLVYLPMPIVYRDKAGVCLKVDNLENGQAFNCNDVDVILRRYRSK